MIPVRTRAAAAALVLAAAFLPPAAVATSGAPAPADTAGRTTRAVRAPGRLAIAACRAGIRIVTQAGLLGLGAGSIVCAAGIYYDVRDHWKR